VGRHLAVTGLTLLCVVAVVGCDTTKPTAAPTAGFTAGPTSTAAAAAAASPVAGTNVVTEADRTTSADLTEAGGTLSATGSNGAVYTLAVPAGALAQPTTISLSPVTSVAGIPSSTALTAGVQFAPNGLVLFAPATLTIHLPDGERAIASAGVGWRGDGAAVHPVPMFADAGVATFSILHFSGEGLAPLAPIPQTRCTTNDEQDELLASAVALATVDTASALATAFSDALRTCYRDFVAPTLTEATHEAAIGGDEQTETDGFVAYSTWLGGIELARRTIGDPSFTVAPELARSKALGAAFLTAWYGFWNRDCVAVKDQSWHSPVKFARIALAWTRQPAVTWGVATRANKLDVQSLLDNLCAKVVIDSSRTYTAVAPGDTGDVNVTAGIAIDNGPVQTAAGAVRVRISLTGSTTVLGEGPTDAEGVFSVTTPWPDGVNPVRFDILATLIDNESLDESVIASIDVPTDILRFDRITKMATRLSFTFDHGFDSWTSGAIASRGSSPNNWGSVDHQRLGGGVMHLDGRGDPSRPNSWIFRSFDLPASTTAMSFDVSAEVIAGSSSSVIVRLVTGKTSTVLLSTTVHNSRNSLSFTKLRVDLQQWAGQHVTIYIEQNDNTPAGGVGFDKEIYIDNVKIALS
jgi:hypothetical protein